MQHLDLQVIRRALRERIVFGRPRGRRGHPMLLGRRFWGELRLLRGAADACLTLELDDPGLLADIDTPMALQGHTL